MLDHHDQEVISTSKKRRNERTSEIVLLPYSLICKFTIIRGSLRMENTYGEMIFIILSMACSRVKETGGEFAVTKDFKT